jgi:predicted phage tail protein
MTPEQKAQRDAEKKEGRKKKLEAMRNEMKAKAQKEKEEKMQKKRKVLDEKKKELQEMNQGKPVEKTYQAEEDGWYRFCVEANYAAVSRIWLCCFGLLWSWTDSYFTFTVLSVYQD